MFDWQAVCQLQVYRYPFPFATSNPKIPDGKLTQSHGYHFQTIKQYIKDEMLFVLSLTFGSNGFMIEYQGVASFWTVYYEMVSIYRC